MNKLKKQFLGFMNTSPLFDELNSLKQFKLDINEIKNFDFTKLKISDKLSLGRRVERFFEFYIKESENYELIKNNIQIIKKLENHKHTLGELDFIIYDKNQKKYLHIEHVYKFYLYDESIENEIDRFIGPNNNDTFSKKISKLTKKQLPLLYKDETKEYLNEIDINSIEQRVCLKAKIYVPRHLLNKKIPIINNACISGFYLKYEEFIEESTYKDYEYFLPYRFDWVNDSSSNEIWLSYEAILYEIELFLNLKKSPLVFLKNKKDNKTQSFFVTCF